MEGAAAAGRVDDRIVAVAAAAVVGVAGVVVISSKSPDASANSSQPLALRTLDPPSRRAKAEARASKRLFIGGLARGGERENGGVAKFFRFSVFVFGHSEESERPRAASKKKGLKNYFFRDSAFLLLTFSRARREAGEQRWKLETRR